MDRDSGGSGGQRKILDAPMVKKSNDVVQRDSQLTAAVAETVFGWRNVHTHEGRLIGKKQDKAARWRTAKVPDYAGDMTQAYEIDERIKQFGKAAAYFKELVRVTKAKNLPVDWTTPEQRGRAAISVLGANSICATSSGFSQWHSCISSSVSEYIVRRFPDAPNKNIVADATSNALAIIKCMKTIGRL